MLESYLSYRKHKDFSSIEFADHLSNLIREGQYSYFDEI